MRKQARNLLRTTVSDGYNDVSFFYPWKTMESEQFNIIAHRLDDVAQRAAELRRYL